MTIFTIQKYTINILYVILLALQGCLRSQSRFRIQNFTLPWGNCLL